MDALLKDGYTLNGQTRPTIDALLKDGGAPTVKLGPRWTLSWKTEMLLKVKLDPR